MRESVETVSISEACVLLNSNEEQLRYLMCGPEHPDLPSRLTVRHLLAGRMTMALVPMVRLDLAVKAGITAAHYAEVGGGRVLIIADRGGEAGIEAYWRDAHADNAAIMPFICAPADDWLTALSELVADHRRVAARPN